ncbi:hypothetical protein BBJ28_00021087, partial [Nothophytophthora sp. Chile5]
MERIASLLHNGVTPYVVFDGGPLPMKKGTEEERRKYRLKAQNVPYVVAPYEADAQLAYLMQNGLADGVITEDSDCLPFGCHTVLFKMDRDNVAQEIQTANLKKNKGLSFHMFTEEMVRNADTSPGLEIIRALRLEGKVRIPATYEDDFKKAVLTFRHQRVYNPQKQQLTPLTPVPANLLEEDAAMDFVGPMLADDVAKAIAEGDMDPITMIRFPSPAPLQRRQGIQQRTAPRAARASKARTLPKQKAVLTSFFHARESAAATLLNAPRSSSSAQQRKLPTSFLQSWTTSKPALAAKTEAVSPRVSRFFAGTPKKMSPSDESEKKSAPPATTSTSTSSYESQEPCEVDVARNISFDPLETREKMTARPTDAFMKENQLPNSQNAPLSVAPQATETAFSRMMRAGSMLQKHTLKKRRTSGSGFRGRLRAAPSQAPLSSRIDQFAFSDKSAVQTKATGSSTPPSSVVRDEDNNASSEIDEPEDEDGMKSGQDAAVEPEAETATKCSQEAVIVRKTFLGSLKQQVSGDGSRQASAKCALTARGKMRMTPRNAVFVALGLVFALYMYFNVRFFASSSTSTNSIDAVGKGWRSFNCLPAQATLSDGEVADVEASTRAEFIRKKDPRHHVHTRHYADVGAVNTTFGEKLLTTTLNPVVLVRWMLGNDDGEFSDNQALPFAERYALAPDDYVMAVDSDAIFTKKLDMWNLMAEANDVIDPHIFGQDASWYWPNRFPLTAEEMTSILPTNSRALLLEDWREYAAVAPFVAEVRAWQSILPTAVDLWDKLAHEKRFLAVPIAAAHEKTAIGISGVLSVHHYPSRYQNWDFVDDIKHNPCNELAEGRNLALSSYPISIRGLNFTLPQWIDGREWSFYADQVPSGFFMCDAWMLRQPTGELWHLVTHTSGYERVPNILRRRHTMSVCLAVEAYNSASESYRSHFCPTGFNRNRRIPMEYQQQTWAAAVAVAPNTPMEENPPVYFGNYKKKKRVGMLDERDLKPGQEGSDDLHFVFSTSCEPYQDWMSEALAQSFARVGQHGALTRIVAGCSDAAVKALLRRTQKSAPHLRIHVTRDFRSLPMFKEVSD